MIKEKSSQYQLEVYYQNRIEYLEDVALLDLFSNLVPCFQPRDHIAERRQMRRNRVERAIAFSLGVLLFCAVLAGGAAQCQTLHITSVSVEDYSQEPMPKCRMCTVTYAITTVQGDVQISAEKFRRITAYCRAVLLVDKDGLDRYVPCFNLSAGEDFSLSTFLAGSKEDGNVVAGFTIRNDRECQSIYYGKDNRPEACR